MCFSAAVNEVRLFIREQTELSIAEIEYVFYVTNSIKMNIVEVFLVFLMANP